MDSQKRFTLLDLIIICVGSTLGAAIFIIAGTAISRGSASVLFSTIGAALLGALACVSFYQIYRYSGKEGGVYEYVREGFSPNTGFVAGWLWAFAFIACAAAAAFTFSQYVNAMLVKSFPIEIFSVLGIIIAAGANFTPLRNSMLSMKLFLALALITLLLFVIYSSHVAIASVVSSASRSASFPAFLTAVIMFFTFVGFSRVTAIKRDVLNAEVNIKRALWISLAVSTILYIILGAYGIIVVNHYSTSGSIVTSFASYEAAPPSTIPRQSFPISLPLLEALALGNNDLVFAFGTLGLFVLLGIMIMCISGAARVFYTMGRDNDIPRIMTSLEQKTRTPIAGVVLASILAIILVVGAQFNTIIDTISATMLLAFLIVHVTALNLAVKEKRDPKSAGTALREKWFPVFPILGIALNGVALYTLYQTKIGLTIALVILLVGGLYFTYGKILLMPKSVAMKISKVPDTSTVRDFVK